MKQPGSFLKGSGTDDTQRTRTAPAAPGAKVDESRQAWILFLLINSFLSVAPKEKRPRRSPRAKKLNDVDALFRRLKRDVKADYNSKGRVNWRKEARERLSDCTKVET